MEKVNNANIKERALKAEKRASAKVEEFPELEGCLVCSENCMEARTHLL